MSIVAKRCGFWLQWRLQGGIREVKGAANLGTHHPTTKLGTSILGDTWRKRVRGRSSFGAACGKYSSRHLLCLTYIKRCTTKLLHYEEGIIGGYFCFRTILIISYWSSSNHFLWSCNAQIFAHQEGGETMDHPVDPSAARIQLANQGSQGQRKSGGRSFKSQSQQWRSLTHERRFSRWAALVHHHGPMVRWSCQLLS